MAYAHLGAPSLAPVTGPVGAKNVVDTEYVITWTDYDQSIPTGTATVDLFYTQTNPEAYYRGQLPPDLHGDTVVKGILEKDPTNRYVWNTSTVAAGTYWIWSRVNEPAGEQNSGLSFIEFSPGVITIAHPGDPMHPAIVITRPNKPVAIATDDYLIEYEVFDPDGSGRVKLEAAPSDEDQFTTLVDEAVTSSVVQYLWDTSSLRSGDWKLKASISDNRGLSFVAHSRYFVTVSHLANPDGGIDAGAVARDSGLPALQNLDSGIAPRPTEDNSGCSCRVQTDNNMNSNFEAMIWLLLVLSGLCSREILSRRPNRVRRSP